MLRVAICIAALGAIGARSLPVAAQEPSWAVAMAQTAAQSHSCPEGSSSGFMRFIGKGEAKQQPDIATLSAAITASAWDAKQAHTNADAATQDLAAAISKAADWRPVNVSILAIGERSLDPWGMSMGGRSQDPSAFVNLEIELGNATPAAVSSVLGALSSNGQGHKIQVNQVQLSNSQAATLTKAARQAAVANARDAAQTYREAIGVQMGPMLWMTELPHRIPAQNNWGEGAHEQPSSPTAPTVAAESGSLRVDDGLPAFSARRTTATIEAVFATCTSKA